MDTSRSPSTRARRGRLSRALALLASSALALGVAGCPEDPPLPPPDAGSSTIVDGGDDHGETRRDGATAPVDGATPSSCEGRALYRCDGDDRVRCVDGEDQREACGAGCRAERSARGEAQCMEPAPEWDCGRSGHGGEQYWTCDTETNVMHRCVDGAPVSITCADGCIRGALGTEDYCRAPGTEPTCGEDTPWRCEADQLVQCVDGRTVSQPCASGCLAGSGSRGDARCIDPDPSWDCSRSAYGGEQYWTCDADTGAMHRCIDGAPVTVACEEGCVRGPAGTQDRCVGGGGSTIPMPTIVFHISGGLFTEEQIRGPVEAGVEYMLERLAEHVDIPAGASIPTLTVNYSPSSRTYCSGEAFLDSTDISCPYGYPREGASQNYVTNLTVHELGHLVAYHLLGHREARNDCLNEGLASWMAGRYWMAFGGVAQPNFRETARAEIRTGEVWATIDGECPLASDRWYHVWASYFEYLEGFPGEIGNVATGVTPRSRYSAGWQAWLE